MTSSTTGSSRSGVLLCVLANPPTTSGIRTMSRVNLACALLRYDQVRVENLFAMPSHSANDISLLGRSEAGWLEARAGLAQAVAQSTGVLLAYGMAEPSGLARVHHRDQVAWLWQAIANEALPVFQMGDGPRHPSRWHRWTSRFHVGLPFAEGVRNSLLEVERPALGPIRATGAIGSPASCRSREC
ncbi:hypothetical protein PJL18_00496 [Paenarthrobacter nicotinovorans]|nr:hypothetical protein [Paenarthrobacter nicotinovorans]